MEAKLIKEQMTKGEWTEREYDQSYMVGTDDVDIAITENFDNEDEQEANAAAIVFAVNNTFGKGINPEKVEKMYDMLDLLLHHSKMSMFNKQRLTELLTSAKL